MLTDILKSFYKMKYDEEPDYGCILFKMEKILLEEDSVPHSKNYDWVQSQHNNNRRDMVGQN